MAAIGIIGLIMMLLLNDLSPTTAEYVENVGTGISDSLTGD